MLGHHKAIPGSGCMQTYYHSITAHPDTLGARVRGPRGAPVRCTPTPPAAAGAAGRAIFSGRHPGIPMNSYRISVLILNLPDFSELAPPYMHQGYIRSHVHPDPGIALWWPSCTEGDIKGQALIEVRAVLRKFHW